MDKISAPLTHITYKATTCKFRLCSESDINRFCPECLQGLVSCMLDVPKRIESIGIDLAISKSEILQKLVEPILIIIIGLLIEFICISRIRFSEVIQLP